MADVVVLFGVLAFFALCVLLVNGLDRLVGRDDAARGDDADVGGRGERAVHAEPAR
jgi:hypothetical protein